MAYAKILQCDHCGFSITAWDEGNPYYYDPDGKKVYVYHPNPDRDLATGIESPHLCLDCGRQYQVDDGKPVTCRKCKSTRRKACFDLEDEPCPKCKQGKFFHDPTRYLIS